METINLPLTIKVFKEGSSKSAPFVAYNPELDISSCGKTENEAEAMLHKAVTVLIEGAKEDGTLNQLLQEAGLLASVKRNGFPKTYFSVFSLPLAKTAK